MPNGREKPVAKIITSGLSSIAEIHYQNRREAQGKYKGSVHGTGLSDRELLDKHADIVRELSDHSIRQTARLTGKSKTTVLKVKKRWNA